MSGVGVSAVGFEGVVGGFGLVGGGPVELGGVVGGPFVVGVVSDGDGVVVGAVAVVDDEAVFGVHGGPDVVVSALGEAAGVELGGVVTAGEPVAGVGELAGLFTMPATAVVYTTGEGVTGVVSITTNNRRTTTGTTPDSTNNSPAGTENPAGTAAAGVAGVGGLDKLINVALQVSVELGRTRVTLADVLDYDVGSIIELDRAAGAPVDIRVNDTLLAQGEVVLIDDEYAVRITAIIDPHQ